jgi:peptide deformylase
MALLQIEKGSENKILRADCEKVKKIDKKLFKFLDDMRATMYAAQGVGLAAPQVGVNIRAVICRFNYDTDHETVVEMINPEILSKTDELLVMEEGCLSIPGKYDEVARHGSLTVKFTDRKGREQVLKLKGFNARIVQHEVDHIHGTLYVDKVEPKV